MKLAKGLVYLLKSRRIHLPTPPAKPPSASWPLYHTNCRCNTRDSLNKSAAMRRNMVAAAGAGRSEN